MFVCRGGGLRNHGGQQLHGVGQLFALASVTILYRKGGELVGSVDASQQRRFDI
jgi:hypothetical protein